MNVQVRSLLLFCIVMWAESAWTQEVEFPDAKRQAGSSADEPAAPRVVRVYFDDPVMARKIVISMEALESVYEKGYVVVLASDADLTVLRRAGLRVVADETFPHPARPSAVPRQTPKQDAAGTIPGYACYRTVEETYASAQAIVDAFPELATWTDVGDSWKKTQNSAEGYDLMVLKLTNATVSGPKPKLFITSALHAREYTVAELATRFAEDLVDSYGIDADTTWLLDEHEVHLLLHANPDGRKRAEEGLYWRKNHNEDHCAEGDTGAGEWPGVDLNRNFDFKWGSTGSSAQACAQIFRGSAAASEPETQAITAYMQGLFPDARGAEDDAVAPADTSGVFLDIHSHGRLVLWSWGHTDTTVPNGTQLQTLGRKLAFFNGHTPMQSVGLYPAPGVDDYGYGELGVASYTFELGTSFFQDCNYFENTILPKNLQSLRYAFKVARTPYITPAGPDAVDVSLSDGSVEPGVLPGTQVTLSATLNDGRYSTKNGAEPEQIIAAGEYYVDVPPWGENPSAISMAPVDGAFDGAVEAATAVIDTTGWSEGRHLVFVRAKDVGDNWGAVSAAFLFIAPPPPPPPPPPPSNTGGGGSSGSSGSRSRRSSDQHGNTAGQATRLTPSARAPWASSTAGQLNSTRDIDYFTLTVPHAGILVVETTGSTDTVGTVWQAGVELGQAASGGERQNFRLAMPVAAGEAVMAVAGNGRRTGAYRLETHLVVGYLENPGPDSFLSGIGALSGWVCDADRVEIELNGVPHEAAYGTERLDTAGVCGDVANGFGLLFNWNLLGDGAHTVGAVVDGVELGRATVTVTTLGAEFVRDVEGECLAEDFPSEGKVVSLARQEAQQNFVLAAGSAPTAAFQTGIAGVGYLENPSANSFQSGIGVISGWVCEADAVTITLGDLAPQVAGYGTARLDTLDVCGDTDNGFGLLFNWNLLGDGEHEVIATVDGTELARTTVRVTTLGEEFVRGAAGECVVPDFPHPGETVTLTWQQTSQNFVITQVE